MTDDLYSTRLRFNGRSGIAKLHGLCIALDAGPDLGSGPVWFVDYRPEVGLALVQPRAIEPVRDMTLHERRAADELLRAVVGAAV
ncbi:MAG: hypothetical protein RLZZ524_3115 [Pseudomonadota bacterium]